MKKLFRKMYTLWMALCFMGLLLPLIPFFRYVTAKESRHSGIFRLFKIWSNWFYVFIGMSIQRTFDAPGIRDLKGPVVMCANHTSYLDIPVVTRTSWIYHKYIGKVELTRVPIFGSVFKAVGITVDRKDPNDRRNSLEKMYKAVDQGASIAIFPEGSINKTPPALKPFRDGAFKVAIEKQIPILPITILDNWRILPGDSKEMRNLKSRAVYHEPIDTKGMTMQDVKGLNERVQKIIEAPLRKEYPQHFKQIEE